MTNFIRIVNEVTENGIYMKFDLFFMEFLGIKKEELEEDGDAVRRRAYRTFLSRVGSERPASLPTIRRWFGIGGSREPSREQVFRIAFSLKLNVPQTKEFLMRGIGEPTFQINDYTEMIAMYCLEQKTGCAKWESLVGEYEKRLDLCEEISKEANTNWLFHQFEYLRSLPEEEFMYWMWEHSGIFKGYSRTVQEYLERYRALIIDYAKRDMKRRLDLLLSETGYQKWRAKRRSRTEVKEGEWIRKYVRQSMKAGKGGISKHIGENILELSRQVYSDAGANTKLMSELFYDSGSGIPLAAAEERASGKGVRPVSGKYVSDLFNIPTQNERMFRAKKALRALEDIDEEVACPDDVRKVIEDSSHGKIQIETAGEARDRLREMISEGRRRRLIVKRTDLLPMILYVSQQRYLDELGVLGSSYDRKKACQTFRELADATLLACNMAPLNEEYLYDMVLLSCFQENEMYGYADVLEAGW